MRGQAILKKIAIDRLRGGCALTGRDDHLAVGRRYATGRVKTRNTAPHALVDFDLPVGIEFRAEFLRELVVEDIAAGRENVINLDGRIARKLKSANFPLSMVDVANALQCDRNLVFGQPALMFFVPMRLLAICGEDYTRGIIEHAERVLDRF